MKHSNRREFLKSSAAAAVGASVLASPGVVRGAANDRIRVGLVGCGGRGRFHINSLNELAGDNVELAALCDCDENRLRASARDHESRSGKKAKLYTDMRAVLDDDSIDAVSFATPNHWHSLGVIWACQAGKDVYVEKPGSHNIHEGRKMVEAARKYNKIVQHGTQCRTSPNIREGIEKLREGVIGRVYMARAPIFKIRGNIGNDEARPVPKGLDWDKWLGPSPKHPYSPTRHRGWHYMWDTGCGQLGNQGVHQMDLIRWGLGFKTHPNRIMSMGGHYVHDDAQETPDTQTCCFQWEGRDIFVEIQTRNWYTNTEAQMGRKYPFVDKESVCGIIFLGTDGYLVIPDYSSYLTFMGKKREPGPSKYLEGNPMMDTPHFRNWIEVVRSRKREDLFADIEEGHLSAALCHLGNIAYRTETTLHFDPKAERCVGNEEANKLLTRAPREQYAVPEKV